MAGGLAFYNTNDLAGNFRKALRYALATAFLSRSSNRSKATSNQKRCRLWRAQGITYHNTMVLSPAQYTVKMVVRDNLSGKVGSLSASLIIN
jgi:hypothetical protein